MADLGGGWQQWTTMDNNGQRWTTMDNNGQQSSCICDAVFILVGGISVRGIFNWQQQFRFHNQPKTHCCESNCLWRLQFRVQHWKALFEVFFSALCVSVHSFVTFPYGRLPWAWSMSFCVVQGTIRPVLSAPPAKVPPIAVTLFKCTSLILYCQPVCKICSGAPAVARPTFEHLTPLPTTHHCPKY